MSDNVTNPDNIADKLESQATSASGAKVGVPDAPEKPAKKRGRPPGSKNGAKNSSKKVEENKALYTAQTINGGIAGILNAAFGEEMLPSKEEFEQLNGTLAGYLATKEDFDIPPGVALVFAYTLIYMPKFTKPTVKTRLANIGVKISGFFGKAKSFFHKKGDK